jgi:hypothetical protein
MGFGTSLVKWLLFIFNLIFFILGFAILIIGIVFLVSIRNYIGNNTGALTPAIFFIIIGCIVAIVSFFGCLGAVKESSGLIKTFVVLMLILVVLVVVLFIITLVLRGKVYQWTSSFMMDVIRNYGADTNKAFVDTLQSNFTCCGSNNYTDWETYYGTTGPTRTVPKSCCVNGTDCSGTYVTFVTPTTINTEGCASRFGNWLYSKGGTIAILFAVIIVVQIIGIVFACVVVRQWDYKYEPM